MPRRDESDRRRTYRDQEPRRRRSREADREPESGGGTSLAPWFIAGGGILAAVILVVVAIVVARARNRDVPDVANGTPTADKSARDADKSAKDADRSAKQPGPDDKTPPRVAWQYVPDAAKPAALTDRPMRLAEDPQGVLEVAFSEPSVAQAVVAYLGDRGPQGGIRPLRVDRFDLVEGKLLGTVDLFRRSSQPLHTGMEPKPHFAGDIGLRMAVSPDGKRVVTQNEQETEVSVYDLDSKQLLKRWNAGGYDHHRWLGFPDRDHVFTWDGRALVLWKVADGSEKYRFKEVKGYPVLSPTRKYVAFRSARGIEMVEVATGKCHGLMENEYEPFYGRMPMTFSLDGKELLVGTVSRLYHSVQVKFAFGPKEQPPDGNDF